MVIPRQQYEAEAFRQLSDCDYYTPLDTSTDFHIGKRLCVLLSQLRRNGFLSPREERALRPSPGYRPRKLYLLPKLHKKS